MENQLISVLIIDDQEEIRTTLSRILTNEGYLVEEAENGKQALKICENNYIDAALLDIELPDIKGTELLVRLKEIQPKIVNIIITGHPSIENAVKAVNNKADGYILKPFDIPLLLETLKKSIEDKKKYYLNMYTEIDNAKKNSPIFRYQNPTRW